MIHKMLAVGSAAIVLTAVMSASAQQTPETTQGVGAAEPPRADRPIVPPDVEPVFAFEGGAGMLGYLGGTAAIGPAWQARIRANFTPMWAVEATYLGAVNDRSDNDEMMLTTQIDGSVRFNAFRNYNLPVQPFLTAGVGYAGFATDEGSDLAALVLPIGAGVDRALTPNLRLGARFNLRPVVGDNLQTDRQRAMGDEGSGGDSWSLAAHIGGEF